MKEFPSQHDFSSHLDVPFSNSGEAEEMGKEELKRGGEIGRPKTLSMSYVADEQSRGRQLSVSN